MVHTAGVGTLLITPEGREVRLVLEGDALPVAGLDGQLVHLDGQRGLGAMHVEDWSVPEGPHGMSAWVGLLEARGSQLGLMDRNSDTWYFLDEAGADALWESRGRTVLIEGYVAGPGRVTPTWWAALDGG